MSLTSWTLLAGAATGLALAGFGASMLLSGRAPGVTRRAFRRVRDAGLYHLLFGLALLILVLGVRLPGGATAVTSAVVAVAIVGLAVVRYRPRAKTSEAVGETAVEETAERHG
jgi:hypothetical protein